VAGRDLHPLESAALSRRTPEADIANAVREQSALDVGDAAFCRADTTAAVEDLAPHFLMLRWADALEDF
jgi:hypothetical protein